MDKLICIFRGNLEYPVKNALEELDSQIKNLGMIMSVRHFWASVEEDCPLFIIGKADEILIDHILAANQQAIPRGPESLAIHSCYTSKHQKSLVVSGGDAVGLMYALYELADRIRCEGKDVFKQNIHIEEHPENQVRGVDRFIMNHLDEEWFYSSEFWDSFLKKLARNRFNRFTFVTGFDTAYMTPPYPFFVEVPGFEDIRIKNFTKEKRDHNLEALCKIAECCKENGIVFSFSSWQQKPWTDNQKILVENIPEDDENFTRYCVEGIRTLLEKCPGIAALQFRVNNEAGIANIGEKQKSVTSVAVPDAHITNTHEAFWNAIIDVIASIGRSIKVDLRAKGVTDSIISHALASGLDISIATKYWCEHAALPYHISKLRTEESRHLNNMNSSRRYSYGNMLKKPHWYDMIYRLWNYGSINLFLWGDADYCKRFSKSLHMGEGIGYEINSPLSLKGGMETYADTSWFIHKDPLLKTYRWEDERYWAYYLVFGRYGYSSDTDREIIEREFAYRFGNNWEDILHAYESASKVMPLITTIHFPVHPSLHYWPELYPGAALFAKNNYDKFYGKVNYASALPSDEELFYSIADYVDDERANTLKPKYSPLMFRDVLHDLALNIRANLDKAGCSGDSDGEKLALWVDFSMIALIADFHAWKIAAAYFLYRSQKIDNREDLVKSYQAMLNAGALWDEVSMFGSRYYHDDLQFNAGTGMARNKNWKFRMETEVSRDIEELEDVLRATGEKPEHYRQNVSRNYYRIAENSPVKIKGTVPDIWNKNRNLMLKAWLEGTEEPKEIFLNYRHTDHTEGEYNHIPMKRTEEGYEAVIPGYYFIQGYDVIVYFSALDKIGRAVIYPGVNNPEYPSPYFVIKSGMIEGEAT
jgi:hypothetical protein